MKSLVEYILSPQWKLISVIWFLLSLVWLFCPPFDAVNQPGAVRSALEEANMSMIDMDGIAYTRGPGEFVLQVVSGNSENDW
jgi:hypothetical protein